MPVYMELTSGTKTTDRSNLEYWAKQGPILGPLAYVHTTYAGELKCCPLDEKGAPNEVGSVAFRVTTECLLYYDGMYYGDWSVTDGSRVTKSSADQRRLRQVEWRKTEPPPIPPKRKQKTAANRGRA